MLYLMQLVEVDHTVWSGLLLSKTKVELNKQLVGIEDGSAEGRGKESWIPRSCTRTAVWREGNGKEEYMQFSGCVE